MEKKYTRHKEGKNSTAGWTPEARAKAAERMRRIRGNTTGTNKYIRKADRPVRPGRPKVVWTQARRKAASQRAKKMWAEATPEQRARMLVNWGANGFEKRTHEERVAMQAKVDQEAKGDKISATKKAKFASGEYDYLREIISQNSQTWWNSLSADEQLEHIYRWRKGLKLRGKHTDVQKPEGEKRHYSDEKYRQEQARLYQLACDAMYDTGARPKPQQGLGYYRQLIEFFRPDWVDWEV